MENLGRPAGLVVGPFFVGAVAGWAGGVEGWRWAMVAVAIPALIVAVVLLFVREPERGRNEQEAILGRLLDTLAGSAGAAERRGGAPAQGEELPLPDPRDRRPRVRARERAGAPQLPARRDVPLRRVQARLGALAHVPSRAARDPVRGPDGRPAVPPATRGTRCASSACSSSRTACSSRSARNSTRSNRSSCSSPSPTRASSPRSRKSAPRSRPSSRTECGRRRSR